eukprot:1723342-Prymnesium_polylepis.1
MTARELAEVTSPTRVGEQALCAGWLGPTSIGISNTEFRDEREDDDEQQPHDHDGEELVSVQLHSAWPSSIDLRDQARPGRLFSRRRCIKPAPRGRGRLCV